MDKSIGQAKDCKANISEGSACLSLIPRLRVPARGAEMLAGQLTTGEGPVIALAQTRIAQQVVELWVVKLPFNCAIHGQGWIETSGIYLRLALGLLLCFLTLQTR